MSVYLHMNHDSETVYNQRGPGAHEALASGSVPASFRGLPVYTSYPLDTDFNGAPISLLERDRMIGEWFYIEEDEVIAIFSAEHDKFMKITYADAAAHNVRPQSGTKALSGNPPILIFRPFQTVSVFTRLPVARSYPSHNPSLLFPFAITVDDGVVHPAQGGIGARQYIP